MAVKRAGGRSEPLIREAIQILRSHGVPAAVELDEADFRKLPDPDAK